MKIFIKFLNGPENAKDPIANVGPIAYSLLRIFKPSVAPQPIIYIILFIGCVATLLLAIFWERTTYVGGVEHSTALLILVFFIAIVDCTSSVLYIPYMAFWKAIYLPSYLVGEGFSGLLPALVSLMQGVGGNTECVNKTDENGTVILVPDELDPNFSVDVFFYVLFIMMILSSGAFVFLERLPSIQVERASEFESEATLSYDETNTKKYELNVAYPDAKMETSTFMFLLVVQTWACLLSNGFMPSIQSYACGPYGNIAYHLAATLSSLASPLAALSTMFLKRSSPKVVGILSLFGTALASYIIVMAAMSPSPPLMGETWGSVLIVLAWIAFSGIITYVRVEIANLMRKDGATPLFWSGVVTQAGSAIGAGVAFVLVNVTDSFRLVRTLWLKIYITRNYYINIDRYGTNIDN
ncbi:Solute carrier family 52, riboflavin transporter, member 3-A [Armadillidium vulgare]|nr:Solute carrier family 52, riboflavin transporter, member 3-A [Armadillidium vulgare]